MFTVYFLFLFVNIWQHFFSTPDLSFGSVCVLRLSSRKTSPKKTQKTPTATQNTRHGIESIQSQTTAFILSVSQRKHNGGISLSCLSVTAFSDILSTNRVFEPWIWSRRGRDLGKQKTDVCTIQTSFTQLSFKLNYWGR